MTSRIVTVTLNAAIDKTYYLPEWRHGTVMRSERVLAAAGGKGINVARVLRHLGHASVTATGFAAGYNGRFIAEKVGEAGIVPDFVEAEGESRLCLNFIDGRDGASTEVLEPGPDIRSLDLEAMREKIRGAASGAALVIFSGSLPRGCPADFYAELIGIARDAGAEVFLDTSGAALAEGMKARPAFIKPNEDEIRPWMAGAAGGEDGFRQAAAALADQGIPNVAVTLGAEGAVAGAGGQLYRVRIPRLEAVNAVGSGDAFVAGFAYGYVRGWPVERSLRHAAAAGCANALSDAAGEVRPTDHERLLREIQVDVLA
ncbi:1-phosphofructokinase family hexose kinase [Cohnella nanjingensis]|uniref:Tagatose-6-phosphate kinase n=2 Tax=Cohnella nanjingensis TaxID=1387779 RepID=A0A7X0VI92_9BACL|nr:1-phosphofructokinase family hexose kinase [Cohnella nanjingensis]